MPDLYDIQREKITKKCLNAIINNSLSLLPDINPKNDYYNALIDASKKIIQNNIISEENYTNLEKEIFGDDR